MIQKIGETIRDAEVWVEDSRDGDYIPKFRVKEIRTTHPETGAVESEITFIPDPINVIHLQRSAKDFDFIDCRLHVLATDPLTQQQQGWMLILTNASLIKGFAGGDVWQLRYELQ